MKQIRLNPRVSMDAGNASVVPLNIKHELSIVECKMALLGPVKHLDRAGE